MEKIEIILTNCIKEIKSGKATLAECLDRYPAQRHELEPLLNMALKMKEPPSLQIDSSYKQVAKARLLQQIRASQQKKSRGFTDIFSFGMPLKFAWARVAISSLVVAVLLTTLAGGTAYAAQESLPGELLYPVKTGVEAVRLFLARDNDAKAELNLKFAQTRLVEMSKLVDTDEGKAGLAVNGYRSNLNAAQQQIQKITDTSTLSNLLTRALENVQSQITTCDNIIDTNPKYIGSVNEASTLSINEQLALLELLAQQDNLRAAQINLNNMQSRLQRAQNKANSNQYQLMQEVLLQYQQFSQLGEEILQNAQATNHNNIAIEELSLQSLSSYLDTLDNIYQQVPQDYRNSVEVCRQTTLEFQYRARYRYQKQGNSDASQEETPSENGNGSATGQGNQSVSLYQEVFANYNNGTPNTTTALFYGSGESSGNGSGTGSGANKSGSGRTDSAGNQLP